jgi:Fe2+ or Zn2+ uptake regulation protein
VDYLEKYVKILKGKNLKITPQRLVVLKYLGEHCTHPTTDEIYTNLKSNNPSLSKTTVYNSLQVLEKYGIVQSITISGSELRYDIKERMHHHFLCKKCGRIIDIEIECPNLGKLLKCGHKVDEVHGYFKGICKKCMNLENKDGS